MEIEEFIKTISSESGEIYLLPVVDYTNGKIYEYDTIKHFTSTMVIFRQLKSLIVGFLDEFAEYKDRQYVLLSDYSSDHFYNYDTVIKIMKNGDNNIRKFNNFKIEIVPLDVITSFMTTASSESIYHFIDHCNNINYEIDQDRGWSFLNYACNKISGKNPDAVRYLISKGADMTHVCKSDSWSPLFQIISFSKSEKLIKYAIDKHIEAGLSLNMENSNGETIIERIFDRCDGNIVLYALQKIIKQNEKVVGYDNLVEHLTYREFPNNETIKRYLNQVKSN